eukprot:560645-Rhodomonas_salina.2
MSADEKEPMDVSGSEEESGSEEDVMAKRAPAHTKGELEKHRVTQAQHNKEGHFRLLCSYAPTRPCPALKQCIPLERGDRQRHGGSREEAPGQHPAVLICLRASRVADMEVGVTRSSSPSKPTC